MHLLRYIRERRERRRYRAALTIYLAAYTYIHLPQNDRTRVNEWVRDQLSRGPLNPVMSYPEFELMFPIGCKAAYWAFALECLGIQPAVAGEAWDVACPRRWQGRRRAIDRLDLEFRPYNPTTWRVEAHLAAKGIDTAAIDLYARAAPQPAGR